MTASINRTCHRAANTRLAKGPPQCFWAMPSLISWLDASTAETDKMREPVKLFNQPENVMGKWLSCRSRPPGPASTIRRRGWLAGRPPVVTYTIGAIKAHCSSVRSEG